MSTNEAPDLLSDTEHPPPAPAGLSPRGADLWTAVVARYGLRVDELALLAEACRTLGAADYIAAELSGQPLIVKGSMGQPAPHPLLGELRAHRSLFAAMLRQLKLPDQIEDETPRELSPTSRRAQHAANARWSQERARNAGGGK